MSLIDDRSGGDGPDLPRRFEALLHSALELSAEHDPDRILDQIVQCAAVVADARYAALGVYDHDGHIERFVHHGIDADTVERIGRYPDGRGLLGEVIVAQGPIRLTDLTRDPRACGFPAHHPEMRSFLGVPLRVGDRRYGNLYLTEKRDGTQFDPGDEQIVVTLAAFAAAAIEGALLVAAERERATALSELAAAQERSRARAQLLARVIEAQEAERARVARDLHDQIGQALTSVLLGLRLVDRALSSDAPDPAVVRARSDEVRDLVADALGEVRQLAFELRPTVLDDVGLVAALPRLAEDTSARHDVRVELALDGLADDTRLPPEVETVVYRVVQEALTNVCRHAEASHASVGIVNRPDVLRATVHDDGAGFVVGTGRPSSLGLAGMHERAALVGGTLEVRSAPGAGTRVVLEVPLGDQIRVVLCDDHAIVRSGLRRLLEDEADVVVVGEAGNAQEAEALARVERPDVLVMDLGLPGVSGIEATRHVRAASPDTKVLVLTAHDDIAYLRKAFEAGACGYLVKDVVGLELVLAIHQVAAGDEYVHPRLGAALLSGAGGSARPSGPGGELSEREVRVLQLVAQGHTNSEIAAQLYVSVRTVETHRAHVQQKLGLRSRAELVRYAHDAGVLDEDGPA